MLGLFILVGIPALMVFGFWVWTLTDDSREYKELKRKVGDFEAYKAKNLDELRDERHAFAAQVRSERNQLAALEQKVKEREIAVEELAKQKAIGFPWLANAYADFVHLQEMRIAESLTQKSHPAYSAAAKVKESAKRRREAERTANILRYQIEYYETLFPWLADLKSEEIEDELISIQERVSENLDEDPSTRWLTPEEYKTLPTAEKFQKALERYWTKKKSKWEIGRDYERFIGYKYESEGADVTYHGIIEGFDDLGRDLIVTSGDEVCIVQCKYWSSEKTIHEKHIFQLHGTTIAYTLDHPKKRVRGHFVTSTKLSDRARQFADHLGIEVSEGLPLSAYPCIKCNISGRSKERIYHLPFDQQYDTTRVEKSRGELYVATVAEAEQLGFRRAFRYRGPVS